MYNPSTILTQLLRIIPRNQFDSFVNSHLADRYTKTFSTWNQFVVLATAQIKGWDSLREVETGFLANSNKLYHVGISKVPDFCSDPYMSQSSDNLYPSTYITFDNDNSQGIFDSKKSIKFSETSITEPKITSVNVTTDQKNATIYGFSIIKSRNIIIKNATKLLE